MQESKLIQLLQTLSLREVKKLGLFLKSPYHNQNKKVTALYELLKKYHESDYQSNRIQKETFFYKIFPQGTHYQDNNMRGLMAALHRCIEDFLMQEQLRNTPTIQQSLKIQTYNTKGLYDRFEKKSLANIRQLEEENTFELNKHYQLFQSNYDYYFHAKTEKYKKGVPNLEASMHALDLFYLQGKLRLGLEMKNREKILKEDYAILFWEIIQKELSENKLLYSPIFQLYQNCLSLIQQFEEPLFFETYHLILQHIQQLGDWERQAFLSLLFNFTNQQIRQGHSKYFLPQFELLKEGLNFNIFISNGTIHPQIFLSTINAGLHQKEYTWITNFIENFQQYLDKSIKKEYLKLSQVIIDYHKGLYLNSSRHFESALTNLAQLNIGITNNVFFPRILQIRIYYDYYLRDSKNLNFFLDTISAFQKFLSRAKSFPESKKLPYYKFNQLTRKLALLKCNPQINIKLITSLKITIVNENQLDSKYWLMEKVKELELLNRTAL